MQIEGRLSGYLSDFRREIEQASSLLVPVVEEPVRLLVNSTEGCVEYRTVQHGLVASIAVCGECGMPEDIKVKLASLLSPQLEMLTGKLKAVFESSFSLTGCRLHFLAFF
jgi:hypothetical protein